MVSSVIALVASIACSSPPAPNPSSAPCAVLTCAVHTVLAADQDPSRSATPPAPPDSDPAASAVPEPTSFLLVGVGLVGLAVSSRKWRRVASTPSN
ncbi:MAG: PEP-CTERM sorting domain-containing protein [Planctomycetota bacterium]